MEWNNGGPEGQQQDVELWEESAMMGTGRQTARQVGRQAERQADRQAGRQARQTNSVYVA